jgi:hypothetical protein
MNAFDSYDPDPPILHIWGGPDSIPRMVPILVHAELEALALAGSAMPHEEVISRSGQWESRAVNQYWKTLTTPRATIVGNVQDYTLKTAAVYAEEMKTLLESMLGKDRAWNVSAKIFRDKQGFIDYAGVHHDHSAGIYNPGRDEIALYLHRGDDPELFQRVFLHEVTHAFMFQAWPRRKPTWFTEGIAEYFGNSDWRFGTFIPGVVSPEIASRLRFSRVPLVDLFEMDQAEFCAWPESNDHYAQAWAVVHFLYSHHPQTISDILQKGRIPDPQDIEAEWLAHLDDLLPKTYSPPPPPDKRIPVRVYDEQHMVGGPVERLIAEADYAIGSMMYGVPGEHMEQALRLDPEVASLVLDESPKRVGHFSIDLSQPDDEDWLPWLDAVYRALMRAAKQRKVGVAYTHIDPSAYAVFMELPEVVAYYEAQGFERLGEDWQGHTVLRKVL